MANPNQSFGSGEPGSSGRELFEGSTATGPGEKESSFGTGYKEGTEAGDKGNHGEHDHDLGAGPHKRGGSGAQQSGGLTGAAAGLTGGNHGSSGLTSGNHGSSDLTGGNHGSSGLTGNDHTHGVTGAHSGSGTGDLSGRPADISSALKVPHEEHALHGAGIQSIGGASIGGNHNPKSLAHDGLQGQSVGHQGGAREGAGVAAATGAAVGSGVGHTSSSHGTASQGVSQAAHGATHGQQSDSGRHGLTNQFDHSEDKLLAGARHEADLPTHGQINKDSLNPSNLFNNAADKADQKADENDVKGGSTAQDKAERAANQRNL